MPDVSKNPFAQPDEPEFLTVQRIQHEGREFTREVTGRWFDEWRHELILENNQWIVKEPQSEPWTTHSIARWAGVDIPVRQWFLHGWIPIGQAVSLYGLPGARKSTLLLQWMIGSVLGRKFGNCETPLAQGPAYGLFCEDDQEEIARRARAILNHYQADFDDMPHCHAESLVDAAMTRFVTFTRNGVMRTTPAWNKFIRDLDHIQPILVCLDVGADFFGGNEVARHEGSSFLHLLDRTAHERGIALVLSAHPSLRGIRDKSLASGNVSTWVGGVRARMTLADPSDNNTDEDEDDTTTNQSDQRVLKLAKANYAKAGSEMRFVIRDGAFIPEDLDEETQKKLKRAPLDQLDAERQFLKRLEDAIEAGTLLNNYRENRAYAPNRIATKTFPFVVAEAAFQRLIDKKLLKYDRSKKNPKDRWVITQPTLDP